MACAAAAPVVSANSSRPANQKDCGIHSGVCSGVLAGLPLSKLAASSFQPRQAQKIAMAASVTAAARLSRVRTIGGMY